MRVDGDAAAVVGDAEVTVLFEAHINPARVPGDRLVHGVVDHLGEEVVHGFLIRAADVHARPPAHRLQALQDLDIGGGIGVGGICAFARAAGLTGHERFEL